MNRRFLISAFFTFLIVISVVGITTNLSLNRELKTLRSQYKEFYALRDEYLSVKNKVDAVEGKKSLAKPEGIVKIVDDFLGSLGLRQKVKSVKPTSTKEIKDMLDEEADLQIEKLNMNEMINLFYKIDSMPMILSIKKTVIKTSFENPSLLNVSMTISLIRSK